MEVILIMLFGVLVGAKFFPEKWKKQNETAQMVCTIVLIFCMGVTLGNREDLMNQLASIGVASLLLALGAILGSVLVVYLLTQWLMKPKKGGK